MMLVNPLIKWPGGKSGEIEYIKNIIPSSYDRYVEPFCGGAAVYFYLEPQKAIINDISANLTSFYELIKNQDAFFKYYMYELNAMWEDIKNKTKANIYRIKALFKQYKQGEITKVTSDAELKCFVEFILTENTPYVLEVELLSKEINRTLKDKFYRTYKNELKLNVDLTDEDLENNLLTGVTGGIYMAARSEFNKLEHLSELTKDRHSKKVALFYFVREFCYGSMFRYNRNGDFNIPYGGIGYNNKDYKRKLDAIFNQSTIDILKNTEIMNNDFEAVFEHLTKKDFVFLDPPYDTDFSDYENKSFGKEDQERLAKALEKTAAKFILIIKNTPYIYSLYNKECFKIRSFDNTYSYCVKGRNNRSSEHLIITNY